MGGETKISTWISRMKKANSTRPLRASNILALRRLSESLKVQDDDLGRVIVEVLADGVVICNSEGDIIYTSHLLNELFGYADQELIGQPIEVLVPEALRAGHVVKRSNFINGENTRRMTCCGNLYGVKKSGEKIRVKLGISTLRYKGEKCAIAVLSQEG